MTVRSNVGAAPRFSKREAEIFVRDMYGISGLLTALPSERDQNFYVQPKSGAGLVFKIANAEESKAFLEFQIAVMERISDFSGRTMCPGTVPSIGGRVIEEITGKKGIPHYVRLQDYLPGIPLGEVKPQGENLLAGLGRFTALLANAFEEIEGTGRSPDFIWNPENGLEFISDHLAHVTEADNAEILSRGLDVLKAQEARMSGMPRGLIHNDGNDYNIIIAPPGSGGSDYFDRQVAGIIDFGDMTETWRLNELAVVMAYAMMNKAKPFQAAASILEGFYSIRPLKEDEIEALPWLIMLRLMMSVVISAVQKKLRRGDAYLTISEKGAWDLLRTFDAVSPALVHAYLRKACGKAPCAASAEVEAYLKDTARDIHPVIGIPLSEKPLCVFDLGVGSPLFSRPEQVMDRLEFSRILKALMSEENAAIGIGRYDEERLLYTSPIFSEGGDKLAESRTLHLGMDVITEPGSPVYAPLDGTVLSAVNNEAALDCGQTLILEHRTKKGDLPFFTLYGHLREESVRGWKSGDKISSGQKIAEIGDAAENGGWPPRLHIQIMTDMLHFIGHYPGVFQVSERDIWKSFCLDPNLILQIPDVVLKKKGYPRNNLLLRRQEKLGPSLSLSYRRPLKIVRGFMQHLYDESGRCYLDAVNNVPHVGHCHPRVVEAVQRQQAVLNTNTRYLHDLIVMYAERLTSLLPDSLSVCYFVNSGSEANDLALRMAEAATGGTETIVLDGAYHGNLSSLIAVSPYKFNGPGGRGRPDSTHVAAMPDPYRGRHRGRDKQAALRYAEEIRSITGRIRSTGKTLKAFIAEPLMSCGGQIVFPDEYLKEAYRIVRKAGGVCIADEVQIGFGRVGTHLWGFETQRAVPDVVTMGKPIGNGFPLGAVVTTRAVADAFAGGMEYFNTFGGNPVSCAAGLAVLDVLEEDGLQAHALELGRYLLTELSSIQAQSTHLGDTRGTGLFIGLECVSDKDSRTPDADRARYLVERMKEEGILLSTDGPGHNVVKFKPPLVFSREDADLFLKKLNRVLGEDVFSRERPNPSR